MSQEIKTLPRKIIAEACFKGELPKNDFYTILEQTDRLKQNGYVFFKHERVDCSHTIKFDYVLYLFQ
jgi:hypothetical protein